MLRKGSKGGLEIFYGAQEKEKSELLTLLHDLELIHDSRPFTPLELEQWSTYTTRLQELYSQEEET